MFLKFEARSVRQSGRIVLGIAFILLSLQMVGEATEPLARSLPLPWRRRLVTAVAEAARCTLCCALLPDVGSARADADDCM